MTIGITNRATGIDSARDTRLDFDRAAANDDFAGMLAGAVQATARRPEPKKPKEGTSELDKPEPKAQEDDDKKRVRRSRVRAASDAAAANEASAVVKTTAALDPELQEKLARVMARMRDETGHDVKVTETFRSQERQDALFAQGRDAAGPVVTWTRNSKHTQGRAVDVVLQGEAPTLDAYATLQRIANEEGLRTLGARDPGHLELPGLPQSGTAGANDVTPPVPAEPADATGRGQVSIARLAEVAQVAQVSVAKPAEVARVATVARPEVSGEPARPSATNVQQPRIAVEDVKAAGGSASRQAESRDANAEGDGSNNSRGEQRYGALAAAVALRDAPTASPASAIMGTTVMTGAERAAQIIAAYQDAPARPLSQITMAVDAGNGITDRVQIAMRGSSLDAAIDAGDARGAEAMRSRADELVRSLTRDGIDVEALRVRAAASQTTVAAAPTQTSSESANHSRFDRQQQWQQHDRQRSQDDRREQQRQQRGGKNP